MNYGKKLYSFVLIRDFKFESLKLKENLINGIIRKIRSCNEQI